MKWHLRLLFGKRKKKSKQNDVLMGPPAIQFLPINSDALLLPIGETTAISVTKEAPDSDKLNLSLRNLILIRTFDDRFAECTKQMQLIDRTCAMLIESEVLNKFASSKTEGFDLCAIDNKLVLSFVDDNKLVDLEVLPNRLLLESATAVDVDSVFEKAIRLVSELNQISQHLSDHFEFVEQIDIFIELSEEIDRKTEKLREVWGDFGLNDLLFGVIIVVEQLELAVEQLMTKTRVISKKNKTLPNDKRTTLQHRSGCMACTKHR
ncbi:hypothetical protein M3Y94_00868600 [Aphelenchoides besseyi]|nr:hypothetical protein M3Y94_00868600 [Aphelenchoides besseyi]KAI6226669.1 hypothetical protein M3Y95_00644900 [Aphelenchoides besseyi]